MKKFLSLLLVAASLNAVAGGLVWYPFVGPQPPAPQPLVNPGSVVLSMTLDTDLNGTHPTLHIRGTQPNVWYMLQESTNVADWTYPWANVPFQGDADVSVLLTNQCMFFRTKSF